MNDHTQIRPAHPPTRFPVARRYRDSRAQPKPDRTKTVAVAHAGGAGDIGRQPITWTVADMKNGRIADREEATAGEAECGMSAAAMEENWNL